MEPLVFAVEGDDDAVEGLPHCAFRLNLRRRALAFFVRDLLINVLIVQAALLSLWITPLDHSALTGRVSQLVVAMLIVQSLFQRDLGLGTLSYLTWNDLFAILQFTVSGGM
jgi:hypothetical protein